MAKIRQAILLYTGCPVYTRLSGAPCLMHHLRKLQRLPLTASTRGMYGAPLDSSVHLSGAPQKVAKLISNDYI
jgi:hypothetical protein